MSEQDDELGAAGAINAEAPSVTVDEGRDNDDTDPLAGAPSLAAALEALLMVAVEPMSAVVLAEAVRAPVDDVEKALAGLAADYVESERGFELREVAGAGGTTPPHRAPVFWSGGSWMVSRLA